MKVITAAFQADGDGAFTRRCELFSGLLKRGIHVLHLGPPSPKLEEINRQASTANCEIFGLPAFRRPAFQAIPTYVSAVSKALRNADVAVAFSELELLTFELAFRFTNTRRPCVFIPRASASEKSRLAAELSSSLMPRLAKRATAFVLDNVLRLANAWSFAIVQTPLQRDQLRVRCPSLPILVVPNNINPSWIVVDQCVGATTSVDERIRALLCEENVILSIANQYYKPKGIDLLLDALEYLPREIPWRALLVGDGPDAGLVRREIVSRGLSDRVHHLGRVPNAHRLMAYRPIVVSYARIDDCPNVILEALYHRCPIVASDIPAHRFLLGETFSGLVSIDKSLIAKRLAHVLKSIDTRATLLGEQEKMRDRFRFDWQALMADIIWSTTNGNPVGLVPSWV